MNLILELARWEMIGDEEVESFYSVTIDAHMAGDDLDWDIMAIHDDHGRKVEIELDDEEIEELAERAQEEILGYDPHN